MGIWRKGERARPRDFSSFASEPRILYTRCTARSPVYPHCRRPFPGFRFPGIRTRGENVTSTRARARALTPDNGKGNAARPPKRERRPRRVGESGDERRDVSLWEYFAVKI